MKKLIITILSLTSLSAFATNYFCKTPGYAYELKLDGEHSEVKIYSTRTGQVFYDGRIREYIQGSSHTSLTVSGFTMWFNTNEIVEEVENFTGFAKGNFGGGNFNNELISCRRRN